MIHNSNLCMPPFSLPSALQMIETRSTSRIQVLNSSSDACSWIALEMKTARFSKTLVFIYQSARRLIPKKLESSRCIFG
jgi:hypothetical protein